MDQPTAQLAPDRLPRILAVRVCAIVLATLVVALTAAPAVVAKRGPSCTADVPFRVTPVTISDPLDPSLLGAYAVLRRPAGAVDQPPPINALADQTGTLGRYNPAFIRQVKQRPDGRRYFLVPGFPMQAKVPPARCLPRGLRAQRRKLVDAQRKRERQPVACLVATPPDNASGSASPGAGIAVGVGGYAYGGDVCPPFAELTKYETLAIGPFGPAEHAGILPDGIALVRVHFHHAPTVQAAVSENFYLYKADPVRRAKLLRRLLALSRRAGGRHARTTAQRRTLARRLGALSGRAAAELRPSRIELVGADGRVIENVKRAAGSTHALAVPSTAPLPAADPG
jgi:hypothetical protein